MSVIKTWKCDGCGAISREESPNWYRLEIWRMNAPKREVFGPSLKTVRMHVCSIQCGDVALEANRSEIEALEVAAE